MRPFDAAWSVLKAEKVSITEAESPLGAGSFRQVFPNRRDMREVIKVPSMGGQQMTNIAAMDAMAQLGYPVMPEKPVLGYVVGGPKGITGPMAATTQPRANAVVSNEMARLANDVETPHKDEIAFQHQFRDTVHHPLIQYGPIQDPLMQAIGVDDVREANTGVFDDGMKAIDFEVRNLGAHHEPGYSGRDRWGAMPPLDKWLKVPDEQRRSFINLYGDLSRFEPWNEARGRGGYLGTQEDLYRRGLRNLQLMNDIIDNPEQRRLFEFHHDPSSRFPSPSKQGIERWRTQIAMRDKERRDMERMAGRGAQ